MQIKDESTLSRVKKKLAALAVFFFLLTVSPAIYAMSQVDQRGERAVIVQLAATRRRRRALGRFTGPEIVFHTLA